MSNESKAITKIKTCCSACGNMRKCAQAWKAWICEECESSQVKLDGSSGYACRCGQTAKWERARYNGRYVARDYWCEECKSIEDGTLYELAREWDGNIVELRDDIPCMYRNGDKTCGRVREYMIPCAHPSLTCPHYEECMEFCVPQSGGEK